MTKEKDIDELYDQLKKLRMTKNKSQTEVSEYIGFNLSSSLSHVESGSKNISIYKLVRWLYALDVDLKDIINDSINGFDFDLLHKALNNYSSNEVNNKLKELGDDNNGKKTK